MTHSNTYADKIKLHSDTNTILTNGSHNTKKYLPSYFTL